jgi:hypothetical protein
VDSLALLCKSYRGDLDRCASLIASLRRHNRAGLPIYLSVPAADSPLFLDRIGTEGLRLITDEEVTGGPIAQSWDKQQLVKLRFARSGLAANYAWIDSDFVVIRDFDESEFLAFPDVPFTVITEARRDIFHDRIVGGPDRGQDPEYAQTFDHMLTLLARVRDIFKRRGPPFFFGPPVIWSSRVVHALEAWLRERKLSFEAALARVPFEAAWYGEFLLAHPVIRVVPRNGLGLVFARDEEYERFVAAGFTTADLAANGYLAVNFQSKWTSGVPAGVAGPAVAPAGPRLRTDRIDLSDQWRGTYHRVGWGYALDTLRPLHHPEGILLEGFVDKKFGWGRDPGDRRNHFLPHLRPWMGFWHNPPGIPDWFDTDKQAPQDILASAGWRDSLPSCRGLFTLSEMLATWLRPRVGGVPVCSLKHPTAPAKECFSLDAYLRNPSKSIVQIGHWLRRYRSIYELPVQRLHKVLLDLGQPWTAPAIAKEMEQLSPDERRGVVTPLPYLDAADYDQLLSRNLVFLHLHDASANNTIVECIARGTPVLVNPLDAVVEYLGPEYPMYFQTLDEAAALAENERVVAAAHAYLGEVAMRNELGPQAFYRNFLNSPICRELGIGA